MSLDRSKRVRQFAMRRVGDLHHPTWIIHVSVPRWLHRRTLSASTLRLLPLLALSQWRSLQGMVSCRQLFASSVVTEREVEDRDLDIRIVLIWPWKRKK